MTPDSIRKALRLYRTGHRQVAERMLQRIIEADPENTPARTAWESIHFSPQKQTDPAKRQKAAILTLVIIFTVLLLTIAGGFLYDHFQNTSNSLDLSPTPVSIQIPETKPMPTMTFTSTVSLPTRTPTRLITSQWTRDYPDSAILDNIKGRKMRISLDCEANSAAIFAGYFGTGIDEVSFFLSLPVSDNPDKGFVGDVHDEWGNLPPKGYGVYPAPVARLLNIHGVAVKDVYGYGLPDIKREIAGGRPVIVWVIGRVEPGVPVSYTSQDGENIL